MSPIRSILACWGQRDVRRASALRIDSVPPAEVLECRQYLSIDVVLEWNRISLDAIRTASTPPPVASKNLATVHTAIFDAVNSIDRQYTPYATTVVVQPRASKEAAVVAAAYQTLIALFPAQKATFDAKYAAALTAIPDGRAETDGINAGKDVASKILALRANDGSSTVIPYTVAADAGAWQPTSSTLIPALPQWPNVKPWAMTIGSQFRAAAPPSLSSVAYAAALNEVKSIGSVTSQTRTADQTAIAKFWANGGGTATPPGHWNMVAQIVAEAQHTSLSDNARLFAMLNIGLADAAIASWDAKYAYNLWRPVTAIRSADTDSNAATTADSTWLPLLQTPPFQSYTSGHSTFSGTAAAILKGFFATDLVSFKLPSETPETASRTFNSFSEAAVESGISRIYAGIHFSFDNVAGLEEGRLLGEYVIGNFLKKNAGKTTATLLNGELYVNGSPRADKIVIMNRAAKCTVTSDGRLLGSFAQSLVTHITVDAGDGNDFLTLMNVNISSDLYGGRGNDRIIGSSAADQIFGEDGSDVLFGCAGNDLLDGGLGQNFLFGGHGIDTLKGVRGLDQLFGDPKLDKFLWTSLA